jgi:hypothetical protein
MIDLDTIISRSTKPLVTEIEGEVVMMDVDSGQYFNLDSIGSDIWRRIVEPVAALELCKAMERDYDADMATIQRDVLILLEKMAERGLIQAQRD